ncbi:hypothetical protein B0H17DRAFT_1326369 [Mycena rosella]|uniref:GST N-terminal domain-containing protein n=1 Tax=Mycena rosella TaxID=1033263 RepID=A0AAD7GTA1_MYCRO|nr:hypothetical protein B0H17DRAFT_1326369 [Mycena rosella]
MTPPIVFYDIPSTLPNKAWSPNTWKTRYALNYKGVPYTTVWVEYPDIEPLCRDIGATPTSTKADGRPHYTLPIIHDPSTGLVVSDSTKIAAYLDATYSDTPRLIPVGTMGLQRAFEAAAQSLLAPVTQYGHPAANAKLNPTSEAYIRRTREAMWRKTLEELTPKGAEDVVQWAKVKEGFGKMDEWIGASGEGSAYIMGDAPCYADMWIAGYVVWIKLILPDKWEDMKLWHGGRWATLLQNLEKYETVM